MRARTSELTFGLAAPHNSDSPASRPFPFFPAGVRRDPIRGVRIVQQRTGPSAGGVAAMPDAAP